MKMRHGKKWCGRCKQWKALGCFAISRRDGLQRWCRTCAEEYKRQWRKKNPARVAAHRAAWEQRNPAHTRRCRRALKIVRYHRKREHHRVPVRCMHCGKALWVRDTHTFSAHHPDYSFPYHVIYLCNTCHTNAHNGSAAVTVVMDVRDGRMIAWTGKGSVLKDYAIGA